MIYLSLSILLAGKRTPGLRLGPTPNKSSLIKRQKMTPKTGINKRKLQLDDAMVLHAEYMLFIVRFDTGLLCFSFFYCILIFVVINQFHVVCKSGSIDNNLVDNFSDI